ncbi:MAG: rod shape-determining protein RodA, partial [Candidatus Omnitrophica bacterium]|nr:rod shape-determining protein RodA [Candidatus Omnitrophota bacterium]
GPIRSGAQRWLNIGGLNFQPAEFAKLTALLILTRYFVTHRDEIKSPKVFLTALGIILPYIGLIFLQPDLGSALVMVPLFLSLSFICGVKRKNLFILFFLGILFSPLFWYLLKDYQKQRLLVFLNPHIDPLGAGYTIIQAKIAIGSGRLWGKGWGSHLFSFLPESHTDFIFASLAEQGGFFGAGLVILIYYLLLKEIIWKGILSHNLAEKAIAGGIATLLFSHIFINIGMCLGILPVVGIPLPFISYGGSHLVVNMWALGIVSSLGRER